MNVQTTSPDRQPVVFTKDGDVFAGSRDVAAFFEKEHRHVLRDIDRLIEQEPSLAEGGVPTFGQTPYLEPSNGQTYRAYAMTRDGFTLLAMGFTGAKALQWKLRYIEAFNMLAAELRSRPASVDVRDPAQLANIAVQLIEMNTELEARAQAAEAQADGMREDVAAHERLTKADGSLAITDAAKALAMRPKDLFAWLSQNGWIYRRAGSRTWLGYQAKCNQGLMEHKTTTVLRADGSEKVTEQVRVTPKGLSRLTKLIQPAAKPIA